MPNVTRFMSELGSDAHSPSVSEIVGLVQALNAEKQQLAMHPTLVIPPATATIDFANENTSKP